MTLAPCECGRAEISHSRTGLCEVCFSERKRSQRKKYRDDNLDSEKESWSYYYRNPERRRKIKDSKLRRLYGIDLAALESMTEEQQHLCMICKRERPLVVDHNHDTGIVRSLLCQSCNRGLGSFGEDVGVILAAAAYLKEHNET